MRSSFYRALAAPEGIPEREWYKNRLWAPGLDTGYAAEMLPVLRLSAKASDDALERELSSMIEAVRNLEARWRSEALEAGDSRGARGDLR